MKIWRVEFCQATSSTVLTLAVSFPRLRFGRFIEWQPEPEVGKTRIS